MSRHIQTCLESRTSDLFRIQNLRIELYLIDNSAVMSAGHMMMRDSIELPLKISDEHGSRKLRVGGFQTFVHEICVLQQHQSVWSQLYISTSML